MLINGFCAASAGGSATAVPLCWWQGWSGRWYVASAMPLARLSCAAPGFFLLVNRSSAGCRTPVTLGCSDNVEGTLTGECADGLHRAIRAGANEVHVNLLADGAAERETAVTDIARGWNVPLWQWSGSAGRA
jgi:hypothetical protein